MKDNAVSRPEVMQRIQKEIETTEWVVTYKGLTRTIGEWAEDLGMSSLEFVEKTVGPLSPGGNLAKSILQKPSKSCLNRRENFSITTEPSQKASYRQCVDAVPRNLENAFQKECLYPKLLTWADTVAILLLLN